MRCFGVKIGSNTLVDGLLKPLGDLRIISRVVIRIHDYIIQELSIIGYIDFIREKWYNDSR